MGRKQISVITLPLPPLVEWLRIGGRRQDSSVSNTAAKDTKLAHQKTVEIGGGRRRRRRKWRWRSGEVEDE